MIVRQPRRPLGFLAGQDNGETLGLLGLLAVVIALFALTRLAS